MNKGRILHYDLLRILAAFSVVMLHSAAQFWYTLDIYGRDWLVANTYDAAFRFGVPVFVMISGAIFLSPTYQLDMKRLYRHNILRFVIMYVVWSSVYGLLDCVWAGIGQMSLKEILREMLMGNYHLWFLPMLVGIYVLLPLLKSWTEHTDKQNIQYFLLLFLVIQIGGETLRALTVMDELHYILDIVKVDLICSYVGYFVLGYYLMQYGLHAKLRKGVYLSILPAVVCNVLLSAFLSRRRGVADGGLYDSYGIFTCIIVVAIFVFFRDVVSRYDFGEKGGRLIAELSKDTLGVYIMHVGLMEILEKKDIHSMLLPNIVGIPLYAAGCFLICIVAAAILRRIPVLGRYLC